MRLQASVPAPNRRIIVVRRICGVCAMYAVMALLLLNAQCSILSSSKGVSSSHCSFGGQQCPVDLCLHICFRLWLFFFFSYSSVSHNPRFRHF
ncbi:hypothetical protein I7I50_04005 [Histoplasma capsulatum G186AR]|uniref:Uncharacterized protein n=1 Tax=Ajellomyces capsulatus TaxID=5037 RepID=A0A8H7YJK8_AJECA|nr:hypothetical protein I7I52_04913 [Histoplasma capsulatum]QSS75011.1 hypothetical protein I7I50_04005 [Histoplasma capsulatum G186AR]